MAVAAPQIIGTEAHFNVSLFNPPKTIAVESTLVVTVQVHNYTATAGSFRITCTATSQVRCTDASPGDLKPLGAGGYSNASITVHGYGLGTGSVTVKLYGVSSGGDPLVAQSTSQVSPQMSPSSGGGTEVLDDTELRSFSVIGEPIVAHVIPADDGVRSFNVPMQASFTAARQPRISPGLDGDPGGDQFDHQVGGWVFRVSGSRAAPTPGRRTPARLRSPGANTSRQVSTRSAPAPGSWTIRSRFLTVSVLWACSAGCRCRRPNCVAVPSSRVHRRSGSISRPAFCPNRPRMACPGAWSSRHRSAPMISSASRRSRSITATPIPRRVRTTATSMARTSTTTGGPARARRTRSGPGTPTETWRSMRCRMEGCGRRCSQGSTGPGR